MNNSTRAAGIFHFRGIDLIVATDGEDDFVYAKRLSDIAGLDWRSQKRALSTEENVNLLGVKSLGHPDMGLAGA